MILHGFNTLPGPALRCPTTAGLTGRSRRPAAHLLAVVDQADERTEQSPRALRQTGQREQPMGRRVAGFRRRAARSRSAASGRRRPSAGLARRSSRRRRPGAQPTGAAAWLGRARVVGDDVHLGVVHQRVGVQVRRADRQPAIVDDPHLGVHVQPVVAIAAERADRGGEQPSGPSSAAPARQAVRACRRVRCWPGGQHHHDSELVAAVAVRSLSARAGRSPATTGTGSRGRRSPRAPRSART